LPTSFSSRAEDRHRREQDVMDHLILAEPATPDASRADRRLNGDAGEDYRRLVETLQAIAYVRRSGVSPAAIYVSPQVEQLLGWKPEECVAHPDYWFAHVHPVDRERVRAAVACATAAHGPLDVEYRVTTRTGEIVWLRDMATMLNAPDEEVQVWQGVQFDITASKRAESHLHLLAFYDSLTGLPNRRLCVDRLHTLLSRPDRPEVALLFIDLDRFKFINDGIGHAAGDELLAAVAQRLAARVDGYGSLARYGGDEFVAVLEDIGLPEVEALAETIIFALRRPFNVDGYELSVEGTIGIAFASPELLTPDALLRAADVALYRAKARGGDAFAVYDPAKDRESPDRVEHEAELRRAIESEQFQIAYQPVVDIGSGDILSVEALVRWNHPERGMLRPSAFMPMAEATGLIVPLGRWVIEEACRQLRQWHEHYPALRSLTVSVNLSGRQFRQASLAQDVALVLNQTGLAPENLALEIKEGDALADATAIAATLREFKRLGIRVTIDDFGKGLAALGSLTRFAVDDLKIDGSRISRLGGDRQDIDVVRALVSMAKAMGLDVTAGAVETREQLVVLRELGCDRAQGQHFAPPLLAEEIEQLFQSGAGLG
jgi:diguanylate cyclase (GGDEF)-like protein/PAS domain S-box-containing protein